MKRLEIEFEASKGFIAHQMKHLSGMVNTSIPNKMRSLDSVLMNGIDWKAKRVEQHITLLKEAFSEHLSVLNIRLMYRLQLAIFWLTLAYTVLTLLNVVAVWPQLKEVWHKFNGGLPVGTH